MLRYPLSLRPFSLSVRRFPSLAGSLILGAAVAPLASGQALAQAYPYKPIRVLIGFAAAGTPDVAMRVIAPRLSEGLGQPVIIENRPGAGAVIAMEIAAKAAPDGYTLAVGTMGSMLLSKALFPKAEFDPITSFEPIGVFAKSVFILVSHTDLPARNLNEFIALAKAQPGKINYGSSTPGTPPHILAEMFKRQAGVNIFGITYKGSADAATGFLAGDVKMMVDAYPTTGPLIASGKAVPLLVTSSSRKRELPEVPTAVEAGMPDYAVESWLGLVATGGTPEGPVRRLSAELIKTMKAKESIDGILKVGLEPTINTPEQFRATIKSDWPKWHAAVKDSGADSK